MGCKAAATGGCQLEDRSVGSIAVAGTEQSMELADSQIENYSAVRLFSIRANEQKTEFDGCQRSNLFAESFQT